MLNFLSQDLIICPVKVNRLSPRISDIPRLPNTPYFKISTEEFMSAQMVSKCFLCVTDFGTIHRGQCRPKFSLLRQTMKVGSFLYMMKKLHKKSSSQINIVANLHFCLGSGRYRSPLWVIWGLSLISINFWIALLLNVTPDFTTASACFWGDFTTV